MPLLSASWWDCLLQVGLTSLGLVATQSFCCLSVIVQTVFDEAITVMCEVTNL